MNIKSRLYQLCMASINERIQAIRQSIADAHTSGLEETKSSSGDKYETGRAMMHLEMEKFSTQLAEVEKQRDVLLQINPALTAEKIQNGSVVESTQGNYFLGVSTGIFKIDDTSYITLSAASPLGSQLVGLSKGAEFTFNKKVFKIENVI